MISKETRDLLEQLPKTASGKALMQFLADELVSLKDVTTAKTWEETIGKQHAVKILEKLFAYMQPKKTIDKKRNQYT